MSLVDQKYWEFISSLSGKERVQRSISQLSSVINVLEHRIALETPDLSPNETKKRIANLLYLSDPKVLALINKAI